jgi:TPR repeat protein
MRGRIGVLVALLAVACGGPQVAMKREHARPSKKVTEPPRWKDPPVRVRSPSGAFEVEYPAFLDRAPATSEAWLVLEHRSSITDVKLEFLKECPRYDPARDGLACASPPCRLFRTGGQYLLAGGKCIDAVDAMWWWPTTPPACVEVTGQIENHVGGDPYGGRLVRESTLDTVIIRRVQPASTLLTPSSRPGASARPLPAWRRFNAGRRQEHARTLRPECEKGDYAMCEIAARDLVSSYVPGDDLKTAAEFYQRACEGFRADGCFRAGILHLRGFGVPRNAAKAAKWLEDACRSDHLPACAELGLLVLAGRGVAKDLARARQLFIWSCVPKETSGCTGLGLMHERGDGTVRDPARAVTFYRQACDAGHPAGCGRLGSMIERGMAPGADRRQVVEMYRRACEHGDDFACGALGRLHLAGDGVPKDPEWGRVLLLRACVAGEAESCALLESGR